MDQDDIMKLTKHRVSLVQEMKTMPVVDYLVSAFILNDHHEDEIEKQQKSEDKNRLLLKILKTRKNPAFIIFVEALYKSQQHELAKMLSENDQPDKIGSEIRQAENSLVSDAGKIAHALEKVRKSLKEIYLKRFRKVNPFSLPFTFDIESTWVSLALREEASKSTEDYAKLLKTAFKKEQMLIIEGKPATGKTSLMRRLAYEWAKEKPELSHFDLIIYVEFREVREQEFESITDLVISYTKNFIESEELEQLELLINNRNYWKERCGLILLDGYDESSLQKQCTDLNTYLSYSTIRKPLILNIVLTTRPGYLTKHRGKHGRFVFADVLGFTTQQQKEKYILNHFYTKQEIDNKESTAAVQKLLDKNKNLNKLSNTPLFLTFICLLHERIVDGTLLELYWNIIWWLIDRHQQDFPDRDIPSLFDFKSDSDDKFKTIQENYRQFPQLHCLGKMALNNLKKDVFKESDCDQFNLKPILEQIGLLRKEERRNQLFQLVTEFFFPHRTIQEFLAAFSWSISYEISDKSFSSNSQLNTNKINQYEKFLFLLALPSKMPITPARQQNYLERINLLTLNPKFEVFNSTLGLNISLLNDCFSKCSNVETLHLSYDGKEIAIHEPINLSEMTKLNKFCFESASLTLQSPPVPRTKSFQQKLLASPNESCILLPKKQMDISYKSITFKATKQFCESMKYFREHLQYGSTIQFEDVRVQSNEPRDVSFTVDINGMCSEIAAHESPPNLFVEYELNEALRYVKNASTLTMILPRKSADEFSGEYFQNLLKLSVTGLLISNDEQLLFSDLISMQTLTFRDCIFEANTLVWFTNCFSLKTLKFDGCQIRSSAALVFSELSLTIETLQFNKCEIDSFAWQSITDEIRNCCVQLLTLSSDLFLKEQNNEFIENLQKCKNIKQIAVSFVDLPTLSVSLEEQLTEILSKLVREMEGLKSIAFKSKRKIILQEDNRKIIEKAGQEKNEGFLITYL